MINLDGDLDLVRGTVNAIYSACFSGSLKELRNSVQHLLSVDSPEVQERFKNEITDQQDGDDLFTCLELSALESLRDSKNRTVAHIAAAGGNLDVLQALLTAIPILAHKKDENGENPLFYAIRAAEGCSKSALCEQFCVKTAEADSNERIYCILLLIGHCGPNSMSTRGMGVLHVAAELGDLMICRTLLENHADVNIYSDGYGTPLTVAVARGYRDVVTLLLDNNANPNGLNESCKRNSSELYKGESFPPPLVFAASSGQIEMVKLLIERGADVNLSDSKGWTPLHCAAESGSLEIVKILVESGANCNIKAQQKNAYHLAVWSGNAKIVEFLRGYTDENDIVDFIERENRRTDSWSESSEDEIPQDKLEELKCKILEAKECGHRFTNSRDFVSATNAYSQAIAIFPRGIKDLNRLGAILFSNRSYTYLMCGKTDKALKDAEMAIKIDPDWSKGYLRLANAYKARGETLDYLHNLFQAYTRDPDNVHLRKHFQAEFRHARALAGKSE